MSWDYSFTDEALKNLRKIGAEGKRRIVGYPDSNITSCQDPRRFGKPLKGELGDLWRYRTGHYRIVCKIGDEKMVVLVVRVGHRRNVYE